MTSRYVSINMIQVDKGLIMGKVHTLGKLIYQFDWDDQGWFYMNRANEQVNMNFFMGTIESAEGAKLYQFILGSLMITFAWV